MFENKNRLSFILGLLVLSAGFCIAQDQPNFDGQQMMNRPEFRERPNMRRMGPPPGFDENASGSFRMRRPPRRHFNGSGTMEMMPPGFEGDASGSFRMRRPPRRQFNGSGTMEMMPPGFEGDASGSFRMRRPPRRDNIGSGSRDMFPPEFDENASGSFRMRRHFKRDIQIMDD